jgi:hypothetical protein
VAKSPSNVALPQSNIVRWETLPGGGWKPTGDIVDAFGTIGHNELITMFDGKESELKGVNAIQGTTRAFRRIDDMYEYVLRVRGKVLTTTRATIAADSQARTLVTTGTNAAGQTVNSTMVWERR